MTQAQYNALLVLFNECSEDFWLISKESQNAFFDILFGIKKVSN